MTTQDVLSVYESLAGLSQRMVEAARAGEWDDLARLESECAQRSSQMSQPVPALSGEQRQRKIALLKQIMANDRAIRDVTEPWTLDRVMAKAAAGPAREIATA
jgi:flagellar protein FliT